MNYRGQSGPVEIPSLRSWDPRTGWTITRRWRGTPSTVAVLEAQLRTAGLRTSLEPSEDNAYATLSAQYGAEESQPPTEPLSDTWALVGNDLEKSLWNHPRILAELLRIPDADLDKQQEIALVRAEVDALIRAEQEVTHADGSIYTLTIQHILLVHIANLGLDAQVFRGLISALVRGEEAFTVSQWVLRHTLVIAANSSIKPSLANVGRVYPTDQLRAVEAIPNTIRFDLPLGVWLKRTPTIEQTSADKWTITQEFWHAEQYDPFIYQLAT